MSDNRVFFCQTHNNNVIIIVQCTRKYFQSNFSNEFDFVRLKYELNVLYTCEKISNRSSYCSITK